jgi:hypothetical protein
MENLTPSDQKRALVSQYKLYTTSFNTPFDWREHKIQATHQTVKVILNIV